MPDESMFHSNVEIHGAGQGIRRRSPPWQLMAAEIYMWPRFYRSPVSFKLSDKVVDESAAFFVLSPTCPRL